MGLREFRDSKGVHWKVWNVTPDSLDKRTTAEDYMREWQDGWLCFESADHRRRLASFPPSWEDLADEEMEKLLERSQSVKRRKSGETSGEFSRTPASGSGASGRSGEATPAGDVERPLSQSRPSAGRMTPASGVEQTRTRTVTDSRGRVFVVGLYRVPPEQTSSGKTPTSPGTVLRFISGSIVLDLDDWPDDWDRYTESQLMGLLDRAQPVDAESIGDSLPLRRQTDLPG
jgi:hypothetical protein